MKKGSNGIKIERVWGSTIYHIDDFTIDAAEIATQYTKFKQLSEGTPVRDVVAEPIAWNFSFT
jgi:hypothetical protein